MDKKYSIVLENVEKDLKGIQILRDINLTFEAGKIYGLYGTNGSGKTMLLRMIAGLLRPTTGKVIIQGQELHKEIDFPKSMGVLIETPNFWGHYTGLKVLKTLADIKKIISMEEMKEALCRVGLNPDDKRIVKKYSLGMRQRLGIAQAIMEKPDILILDEPSNALDKSGIKQVESIIREEAKRGATVIIASHNVNDLDLCDELIEVDGGYATKTTKEVE